MRLGKVSIVCTILTALLVLATFVLKLTVSRDRPLLDSALRIADVGDWYAEGYPEFHWLNNDTLLFFNGDSRSTLSPYILDVSSAVASENLGLKRTMKRSSTVNNEHVSLDGKWILWNDGPDVVVTTIDGSLRKLYRHAWPSLWLPDSRHWIQFESTDWPPKDDTIIHDVKSQACDRAVLKPPSGHLETVTGGSLSTCALWYSIREGGVEEFVRHLTLEEAHLGADGTTRRKVELSLGSSTKLYDLSISPVGDRIAYLSCNETSSPFSPIVRRFLPAICAPKFSVRLNVCTIDDGKNVCLGTIPVSADAGKNREISTLAWLPDGKHLSFVCRNTLWRVTVGK